MSAEKLEEQKSGEVVPFRRGGKKTKSNVKRLQKKKKDGSPKIIPCNSVKGKSKEVYPLKNKVEIDNIKQYFRDKIDIATNNEDKLIAGKYLLFVTIGFNTALRASDIVSRKWEDFIDQEGNIKDSTKIQEKKTKKFRDIYLNGAAKKAIQEYLTTFDITPKPNKYVFESREGSHIEVQTAYKAVKNAAKDCNIKVNVGTHTLRKTWAYHQLMAHQNDALFLSHIQEMLMHDSPKTTLRYVGLEQEQQQQYYNDVEL